jgi:hypothetical protein
MASWSSIQKYFLFLIAYYIINDYNLNTRQFVESFSGLKSLSYCCIRASVRNFPYHYLRIGKVSKALLRPFPYTLCVHYEFLMTRVTRKVLDIDIKCIRVRRGVSKRVENGRRPPALRAGYPKNGSKAVTTMVRLQGIEGLGMAGPGEALGSLWPPLAIRPWSSVTSDSVAWIPFFFFKFIQQFIDVLLNLLLGCQQFLSESEFHDQPDAKWIDIRGPLNLRVMMICPAGGQHPGGK